MKARFLINELASFNSFELLPKGLERLRKYDGRIILSYQSDSQLDDVYGHKKAISIRSNTGSKIIFRSPEPSDSKYLSAYLGASALIKFLPLKALVLNQPLIEKIFLKIDSVDIDRNNYFLKETSFKNKKQNEESIDLDFTKIVDDFSK